MKTLFLTTGLLFSLSAMAQTSPLENQESTVITTNEANALWKDMNDSFSSGSECFNRAMSWTYDINKKYGYEAKKILIHYSLKYNQELSAKWGFHIAPVYNVNGRDTVFDKGFQPWIHAPLSKQMWEEKFLIAGTDKLVEIRIKTAEKIKEIQKDIRGLNTSSEFYHSDLKSKQEKLEELNAELVDFKITDEDLKQQRPAKIKQVEKWIAYLSNELADQKRSSQTYQNISWQLKYQKELLSKVKSDLNYAAHIQCKKIDSIEELDFNLKKEWCYIQEVNQYYWGVPQLRMLNYGSDSIPTESNLSAARRAGEEYTQKDFDMNQVWMARKQAFGSDYKEIWSTEYELKEQSATAVSDIYGLNKDIIKTAKEANKLSDKIAEIAIKRTVLNKFMQDAVNIKTEIDRSEIKVKENMDKIYAMAQDVSVNSTQLKVQYFKEAKKLVERSEVQIESLETLYSSVKDKLKQIEKEEKEAAKRERRRARDAQR